MCGMLVGTICGEVNGHAYLQKLFGFGTGSCCPIDCRRVFGGTRGRSLAMVDQSLEPFTKVIYILLIGSATRLAIAFAITFCVHLCRHAAIRCRFLRSGGSGRIVDTIYIKNYVLKF